MNALTETIVSHKNVYVALAAAQADMGPLVKGSKNPFFKSLYADLASLVEAVRTPLNSHGLAFFHSISDGGLATIIYHGESETSVECNVPLIVDSQNMQGYKSAVTYAKRIGLESVTGIAPEDDDGNAAAKAPPPKQQQAPQVQQTQQAKPDPKKERQKSLYKELQCLETEQGLKSFWDDNFDEIASFPEDIRGHFKAETDKKETALNGDNPFTEAAE